MKQQVLALNSTMMASICFADGSPVVWGNTKAIGACGVAASREVLPGPLKLPASLFGMEQIQTVSAGWGHTAFVTGTPTCMPRRPARNGLTASLQIASSFGLSCSDTAECGTQTPATGQRSTFADVLQNCSRQSSFLSMQNNVFAVTGKLFTAGEGAFGQLGLGECVPTASTPVHVLGELATCRV